MKTVDDQISELYSQLNFNPELVEDEVMEIYYQLDCLYQQKSAELEDFDPLHTLSSDVKVNWIIK
jgi:hypothetical protein